MRFLKIICLILILLGNISHAYTQKILSDKQWRDDLNFIVDFIQKTHPNPYFKTPEKFFKQRIDSLYQNISNMTDDEIKVEFLKVIALLKDWHTRILEPNITKMYFPVRIEKFSDNFFITAISKKYSKNLGAKVLEIGKFTSKEAFEKVKDLNSHDNEFSQEYLALSFFSLSSILEGLSIINKDSILPLIIEQNGKSKKLKLQSIEYHSDEFFSWYWKNYAVPCEDYVSIMNLHKDKLPLYLKNYKKSYWFENIPSYESCYFCFNQCANDDDESFIDFTNRLWQFIAKNHVQYLIIDMRNNLGGTNSYMLPFIHHLIRNDVINQKGHLYVITSRKNVSAAVHFSSWLEKHCNPIFVGEPTGAPPNHYADAEFIKLPNSGLLLMVSKWYWMTTKYPWDNREWIEPEIKIALKSNDYFNFKDPVLDDILSKIKSQKIKDSYK